MSPSCRAIALALALALGMWGGISESAWAASGGGDMALPLAPFANPTLVNSDAAFDGGLDLNFLNGDSDQTKFGGWKGRLTFSAPFNASKDTARIDRHLGTWSAGGNVGYELGHQTGSAVNNDLGLSEFHTRLVGQVGRRNYTYYPDGLSKASETRTSWSVGIEELTMFYRQASNRFVAPQLSLRLERSVEAADKVQVIVPGQNGAASTIRERALAAPEILPVATVLLAVPIRPNWPPPVLVSPVLRQTFVGPAGGDQPFEGDSQFRSGRLEGELWLYYIPIDKEVKVRLGLAAFVSVRDYGKDDLERVAYGVLTQVRLGTNSLEY
jgi:hypothetical protein